MVQQADHSTMDAQHKRSDRFDKRVAIWNLDDEKKADVAQQILGDMKIQLEYRSQMFLSIVVATLGLLINATPVVIGAMIIAPILRPIQAVGFATTTGNKNLLGRSLRTLFMSIVGGIFVAFLITLLLPLTQVTNEIAIRTEPTLVDLGIAFASGLVAFLAFGWKKMAAGLAGVAMAASLVPPLAVIGIGIGFGSISIARGSSVLFLTNLIAIIIAGILIFYLFGFYPTKKDDLKRSIINSSYALLMLLILCIPLASSLITITKGISRQTTINNVTTAFITTIDDRIRLDTMTTEQDAGTTNISLSLRVPQDSIEQFTDTEQTQLATQLSEALHDDVAVDLRLIPVTRVASSQTHLGDEESMNIATQYFITSLYHDKAYLLDLEYHTAKKHIIVATLFADNDFPVDSFSRAYDIYMKESYPRVEKTLITRQREANADVQPLLTKNQEIQQAVTEHFKSYFAQTALHKLDVISTNDNMTINIFASTPLSTESYDKKIAARKQILVEIYNKEIRTSSYVSWMQETTAFAGLDLETQDR